jgi:aspartate/methionine/tyrosine aminotransferase
MEYYNRDKDADFNRFCEALDNAKMIEVCSTKLPQLAIPEILGDSRYLSYRKETNERIGRRSKIISGMLSGVPQLTFNETYGAFYNTIIFRNGVLKDGQKLEIKDAAVRTLVESWTKDPIPLDKRFVYYLLGAKGICVVPISSFCSDLSGFRVTLLEEDEEILKKTFSGIKEGVVEYLNS